jgi:GTP-binding protein
MSFRFACARGSFATQSLNRGALVASRSSYRVYLQCNKSLFRGSTLLITNQSTCGATIRNFATAETTVASKSLRQKFMEIPVHPSILQYVRSIGVGSSSNKRGKLRQRTSLLSLERRSRGASDKKRSKPRDKDGPVRVETPPPFGPNGLPVCVVGTVSSLKEPFPKNIAGYPEVAFCGRSNVGKSTLLNSLLYGNQKAMQKSHVRGKTPESVKLPKGIKASVSPKPGETKQITFYQLAARADPKGTRLRLVDLPGYGFAYASDTAAANFHEIMADYLLKRGKPLKRVLILIDARHGMKKADRDFLNMLQQYASQHKKKMPAIQIVLTKCDLVDQTFLCRQIAQVREQLSDCLVREPSQLPIMMVSARAGVGYNRFVGSKALGGVLELQKELAALVPAALEKQNRELEREEEIEKKRTVERDGVRKMRKRTAPTRSIGPRYRYS